MFELDLDDGMVLAAHRVGDAAELHPDEAAELSDRAVARRRADFSAGRTAARQALAALGASPKPIRRGNAGEPLWPLGVVGSITHAAGWALAIAGPADRFGGMGIDLEEPSRYFPELVSEISFDRERDRLDGLVGRERQRGAVEVFAVKEAIYKAFYPRVGEFFGFDAVRVAPADSGYVATFHTGLDPAYPPGREFLVSTRWFDDLVVAWLALPPA